MLLHVTTGYYRLLQATTCCYMLLEVIDTLFLLINIYRGCSFEEHPVNNNKKLIYSRNDLILDKLYSKKNITHKKLVIHDTMKIFFWDIGGRQVKTVDKKMYNLIIACKLKFIDAQLKAKAKPLSVL